MFAINTFNSGKRTGKIIRRRNKCKKDFNIKRNGKECSRIIEFEYN